MPARVHQPGLDGLRAIAVIAVVWFHTGARHATGGFLGVSLFFTLSGFLITGLLLDEVAATGRVRLRAFWGRRVRRLMPASIACLAAVLAVSRRWVARAVLPSVRTDVVAAVADVANWRFVTAHQSYAELFARQPSPVLHFWSLAIEEQFYIVFPIIVLALSRFRRRWAVPAGLAVLAAASVVAGLLTTDHDLVYYGTHTRAAELLIGGLLACAWRPQPASTSLTPTRTGRGASIVAGLLPIGALASFAVLVVTVSQGDRWLYAGGLPALALLWCVLIVGACRHGAFRRVVSHRALVTVGARSYGVYLYHWPVFTLLPASRLHVHGWPARLLQLAIIAALTEMSYRFLEQPIRRGRAVVGVVRAPLAACACVAAVVLGATVTPLPAAPTLVMAGGMTAAPDEVVHFSTPTSPASATPPAASAPEAPLPSPSRTSPPAGATASGVAGMSADPSLPQEPPATSAEEPAAAERRPVDEAAAVVVVGSEPNVVSALAGLAGVAAVDRTASGCPAIAANDTLIDAGPCLPTFGIWRPDVVVLAIGQAEHDVVARALATPPGAAASDVYARAQSVQRSAVAAFGRLGTIAGTIVVIDATGGTRPAPDVLDESLEEASLATPSLRLATVGDARAVVARAAAAIRVDEPPGAAGDAGGAPRVLVLGDSTSYGVAKGLAESTIAPFEVEWAGRRNCPIARMEAIRWLTGDEFSMAECPSVTSLWPNEVASFRPDLIVVVDGLPEQSEQRYAGDPAWHTVGDPAFAAVHDADFAALVELARSVGAPIVLATQPPNPADGAVGWARPELIDGWNAQLAAWDAAYADVDVVDYGGMVTAAELTAGRSLRPDGLHLDDASIASVVGDEMARRLHTLLTAAS